ncbi:ABC transporter ATP-binding protein [Dongia soli]|uniref:Sn-glycerol-3-phosphate ABC transporter ATP-binding protein UgpC n=1 Tax=Dongia soli TaxID=600628 RepID=A0ABU5EDK8_9PROT|nr:sn-glycerol-3-phosphate ABC transporter ATP-binding protein UgpC [Dongia soli]MDY0884458.1 sn-glycerol-3-phosphate ABC transporter ATP-binding protein UgpC [Dongia soli]
MADIELRNVSKRYTNRVAAVEDVNLHIRDGEFMIFLGPSGCGKSTTLRMIAGLENISGGELFIGGKRMNDVAPRDRNIAVVFQSYALYPHMTVAENLAFGLKMHKRPQNEIEERVKRVSAMLGIGQFLERKPAALSGGQRQRVALGRALVRDPAAFLLDEPLSNLDAQLRADMRLELVKLHRQLGSTIIHVTHDQVEAMTMGERICIMKDGRVVQVGAPLDVYRNPANTFVAGFLASPPMNLIEARLVGEGDTLWVEAGALRLRVPAAYREAYRVYVDKPVIFGIRAEDIHAHQAQPDWQVLDANVVALETLGAEVVLVMGISGIARADIAARLGRDYRAQIGSRQQLYVDLAEMQLFDPQTTNAVPRPQA